MNRQKQEKCGGFPRKCGDLLRHVCLIIAVGAVFAAGFTSCAGKAAADVTLSQMKDAVLTVTQFPEMEEQTDADYISEYQGLDISNFKEYYIAQQLLDVDLAEIVIAICEDGKAETAYAEVKARFDTITAKTDMYPAQSEAAAGMVCGKSGNVVYLFCNKDGAVAETALLKLLEK